MLGGVNSETGLPPRRQHEIDARLDAVRARLHELGERDKATARDLVAFGQRLASAKRRATEAYAAAELALASSAQAFRRAAAAHERVASVHERTAASGIGDVHEHERQAAFHRAATAAERQRAEHAESLLSQPRQSGC
jgi:hypothetical protein